MCPNFLPLKSQGVFSRSNYNEGLHSTKKITCNDDSHIQHISSPRLALVDPVQRHESKI